MLRKRPGLAKVISIVAVLAYLGILYLIVGVFSQPKSSNNSSPFDFLLNNGIGSGDSKYVSQILKTTDGGKKWQSIKLSDSTLDVNYLQNLACSPNNKCFGIGYASGSIYETQDDGQNWTLRYNAEKTRVRNIECNAAGCIGFGYNTTGEVFLSNREGTKWESQVLGTSRGDISDITCVDKVTCFAVGKEGRILKSSDGGQNWKLQEAGIGRGLTAISCTTTTNCVIVGQVGTVLATTNGGESWTKNSFNYIKNLVEVECPDSQTCFAVGGTFQSGDIFRSGDAGFTWEKLKTNLGIETGYAYLNCPTTSNCLAVTRQGKLITTEDSGKSWYSQTLPGAKGLTGLTCYSRQNCFVVALPYSAEEYED